MPPTGVPHSQENAPPEDPTVGPCLGSYRGPRRGAFSYGRGIPVKLFRNEQVFDKKEEFEGSAAAAEVLCKALRAADLLVEVEEVFAAIPEEVLAAVP